MALKPNAREWVQDKEALIATVLDTYMPDWRDNPSTKDTPKRFLTYLTEFCQPFKVEDVLGTPFDAEGQYHAMVVQKFIPFRMVCEHHLLPAIGRGAVGYIPINSVVGLSKLTRLVQAVGTEKPGLQEYICDRIADLLNDYLKPKGVIVVLEAEHGCMACRGVNAPGVLTTTASIRGAFYDKPQARAEFYSLVNQNLKG